MGYRPIRALSLKVSMTQRNIVSQGLGVKVALLGLSSSVSFVRARAYRSVFSNRFAYLHTYDTGCQPVRHMPILISTARILLIFLGPLTKRPGGRCRYPRPFGRPYGFTGIARTLAERSCPKNNKTHIGPKIKITCVTLLRHVHLSL